MKRLLPILCLTVAVLLDNLLSNATSAQKVPKTLVTKQELISLLLGSEVEVHLGDSGRPTNASVRLDTDGSLWGLNHFHNNTQLVFRALTKKVDGVVNGIIIDGEGDAIIYIV